MSRLPRRAAVALRQATCLLIGLTALSACAAEPTASAPLTVTDIGARPTLHGTDIGDVIGRPLLVLTDTAGGRFDLRRRPAEELTVLFFGYTRCPDVCPTTMADLAAARRKLPPPARARVTVVFVAEDPTTDTPAVLRGWLDRFDPSFVGLIGGNETAAQALDALKAPRTEVQAPEVTPTPHSHSGPSAPPNHRHSTGDGRAIEHSGSVYAFTDDRVVVYTGGTSPSHYAEDFIEILAS